MSKCVVCDDGEAEFEDPRCGVAGEIVFCRTCAEETYEELISAAEDEAREYRRRAESLGLKPNA